MATLSGVACEPMAYQPTNATDAVASARLRPMAGPTCTESDLRGGATEIVLTHWRPILSARSLPRAIYVVLVMASLGIAAHRPLLFQKLNTLVPADGFPEVHFRLDGSEHLGLVDPVAGGVPLTGERSLDIAALDSGPVDDFRFRFLNEAGRDPSWYYQEHLEYAVVGYVPRQEVGRYYRFLEKILVPLGHEKLEKYVYDGLALLLGFLPRVFVPRYDELMAHYAGAAELHQTALWTLAPPWRSAGLGRLEGAAPLPRASGTQGARIVADPIPLARAGAQDPVVARQVEAGRRDEPRQLVFTMRLRIRVDADERQARQGRQQQSVVNGGAPRASTGGPT
jgi:hypothetical protein